MKYRIPGVSLHSPVFVRTVWSGRAQRLLLQLVVLGLFLSPARSQAETQVFAWGETFVSPPSGATNLVQLAGGDHHIVALRADGHVFAWGKNDYGQTNVPPDITNAVRIAAGSTHSLALLTDGTVRFWGNVYTANLTNPPVWALSNMTMLARGPSAQHVLSARADGVAVDWGNPSYGVTNVPATGTNLMDASAASFHAMVLRGNGTPVAWGTYGTLPFPSGTPVVPASATNVVALASGIYYDLALRGDGTLVGWGASSTEAMLPPDATNIIAIASGGWNRLALRGDGQVMAWSSGGQTNALPVGLSNVVAIAQTLNGYLALSASDGPPLLGLLPQVVVPEGSTAHIGALAVSTTPLSYQWMYDGTNLPGATSATLVLSNAQPGQTGMYTLVASNAFGAVTNSDLTMAIQPLLIQVPPQNQTVAGGTIANFGVTAIGQGPFRYQWQTNGTDLLRATNSSLGLTNVQLSQAGAYSVTVSNAYGTVASQSATLTVVPLFITTQPQPQWGYVGGQVSLSVSTSGKGPYGYQWQFYGTNLPAGTNDPLVLTNLQFTDAGPYSVIVTNAFGAVQSSNAMVSVLPILVTAEPQSQAAFLGQTIIFSVTAQASVPLSYQWQFNGSDLLGATANTLTLSNCQYAASGLYGVRVNSDTATTNSAQVALTVTQVASWGKIVQAGVPASLTNLLAISAQGSHALALRSDRTVARWGDSGTVPVGLTNVAALAAGVDHDLALLGDGTFVGWGDNAYGESSLPNGLTSPLGIAAGQTFSLALGPDGTPVVWGGDINGETNMPAGLSNIVAVATGISQGLVLRADGRVVAWGYNGSGQTNVPPGLSNVVALAAGFLHSMALTSNGRVVVWGDSGYGETTVPASATNVVAIAAGYGHCLALKSDGTVLAWGYWYDGETTVPAGLTNVIGIAADYSSSFALVADGTPGPTVPLTNPHWGPGGFSVSLPTRSGKVYLLEYKNSPNDVSWTGLPLVAGTGGMVTLTDPTATGSQRFYRVRQW